MKLYIQEMIRGHIETIEEEYIDDVCKELRARKIPYKVDYIYQEKDFDTMTQGIKEAVSTAKARACKIM